MGRERKRGALMALNRLLLGERDAHRAFAAESAACERLAGRFHLVATLDADTRALPGTVHALAGALLHPLNRPRVENGARRGYAIVQPNMELSASAVKNGFIRLFAGRGGMDGYPRHRLRTLSGRHRPWHLWRQGRLRCARLHGSGGGQAARGPHPQPRPHRGRTGRRGFRGRHLLLRRLPGDFLLLPQAPRALDAGRLATAALPLPPRPFRPFAAQAAGRPSALAGPARAVYAPCAGHLVRPAPRLCPRRAIRLSRPPDAPVSRRPRRLAAGGHAAGGAALHGGGALWRGRAHALPPRLYEKAHARLGDVRRRRRRGTRVGTACRVGPSSARRGCSPPRGCCPRWRSSPSFSSPRACCAICKAPPPTTASL